MLVIYKLLFDKLNESNVRYFIYKGIEHLNEDLSGKRGDVDLFVDSTQNSLFENVVSVIGYKKVRKAGASHFYYGLDIDSGMPSLLDVANCIPLGTKPYKYIDLQINYADLNVVDDPVYSSVKVLAQEDYLKLKYLIRISSDRLSNSDTDGLVNIRFNNLPKSALDKVYYGIFGDDFLCEIKNKSPEEIMLRFQSQFRYILKIRRSEYLKKRFSLYYRVFQKILLIAGVPRYRLQKKGRLIAFVGVDGAGKSSIIKRIEEMAYFKSLSVKTMYFGNNQYWIPILSQVARKVNNKRLLRFISVFTRIDRQLRIFIALYYIFLGRDILADRYYYDDLYTRQANTDAQARGMKKWFHNKLRTITSVRMLYTPDLTIFLNVSPDVSFSRKQDYNYEKLVNTITGYRKILIDRKEVVTVNADKPLDQVFRTVLLTLTK
ncbi:dTMP kinase [Thermodesulfobacteriota bacterium]